MRRMTAGVITTLKRQRIILDDEGNVGADRLDGLRVIGDDLVVGPQRRRRRDHHRRRARLHRALRQRPHRRKARRRDADDEGKRRPPHAAPDDVERLRAVELRRLAENAQDRAAVGADAAVMVDQPVEAVEIDAPVGMERGRRDREDAAGSSFKTNSLPSPASAARNGAR